VANCDHTSERVHWVHVCIGIEIGDAVKISPRVPSTLSSRSIGRWEDMILPGREDPRNLGQSEWDQKFGKIECEFSLYDKRRWKWDDVYLLRGLPNIYSLSLCPPPLPLYLWICTWRLRSSELRDALGGCDRGSLEMHLEAMLVRTWRPKTSQFGDTLAGRDRASLEMTLQAMIELDWRSTCRRSIWREVRWQLRLYSLVNLYLWEWRELSTTSAERWETGWARETFDLGMMLYLVYAVLCVNS